MKKHLLLSVSLLFALAIAIASPVDRSANAPPSNSVVAKNVMSAVPVAAGFDFACNDVTYEVYSVETSQADINTSRGNSTYDVGVTPDLYNLPDIRRLTCFETCNFIHYSENLRLVGLLVPIDNKRNCMANRCRAVFSYRV